MRAIDPSTFRPTCAHVPCAPVPVARPPDCLYAGFFIIAVASAAVIAPSSGPPRSRLIDRRCGADQTWLNAPASHRPEQTRIPKNPEARLPSPPIKLRRYNDVPPGVHRSPVHQPLCCANEVKDNTPASRNPDERIRSPSGVPRVSGIRTLASSNRRRQGRAGLIAESLRWPVVRSGERIVTS